MNYINISDKELKGLVNEIQRQLVQTDWRPDYIVGLTRGGLLPAVMISHYLNIPMYSLNVSLRDNFLGPESNLWMSEDAFGYVDKTDRVDGNSFSDVGLRKNILLVDDINDSGETFNWIMQDWQSSCLPSSTEWDNIWNHNVKFAVLVDNLKSNCKVRMDFAGREIDKNTDDWVVFPYESWWR